jgi:LuxR family maltose regulon positive regulatory protein
MNVQALQTDKLIPIKLPEICAPRLELLKRFDKASGKRCIYVKAPGGCGKTVSTLLWMQKSGYTPIWLGLDEYDNTPSIFYRLFCSALFSTIPQKQSLSEMIMEPAFNDSPVEYTIDILSRFSFDDGKYALVLDDFYFITNEQILKSMIYILKRLPLSVTVIILSRSELPRFFAPLNESGRIAFITAAELAFKSNEIRHFFSSYGRFITEEEAEQAFSLTEGWVIAVSALALSGTISAEHKLEGGFLYDYLRMHIWDRFDECLRLFFMKTSIVDEISVTLCEQLTKNPDAGKILNMLCGENMFISRQDDKYRYHHVFLDFLRLEAEKAASLEYPALYKTAADYYLEEGDYFDALRFYVKTDDRKGTSTALHFFWNSTGKSSSELARISFINELPADFLERNPYLYISCAWYALFFSNASNFFYHLDKLYAHIQDIVGEYKMFIENMLFLFTIDHRYTFTQQMARLPAGDAVKTDERSVPKLQCQYFPFFHRTHRDYSHYAMDTEDHFAEFNLIFFTMLGSYYPVIESGVRAGLLYEKNQLKESLSLAMSNPATDSDELVFLSKLQIAACLSAMGKTEEAMRQRAEIKGFLEKKNLLYLLPVFAAYETKTKLLDGDKAAATVWLDNYFINDGQDMELHKIYLHFTTARAYIVLGEYNKADMLCERIKTLSCDFGRLLDEIEANVLLTILKWITGKKQEAEALLQTSLAKAEPYHFVRVFADEGHAILSIVNRLGKKLSIEDAPAPSCKFVYEVQQAAYAQSKGQRGILYAAGRPIKLSKQQKYILELLSKSYKNAEIVEMSGLSINTIRYHTKMLYQKLGVGTAMDAVLRARELELIE